MNRAKTLSLVDVRPHRGRCPWRIEYRVDDIPVSAFFRPPKQIEKAVTRNDVCLLALPILCDLVAEVRPKFVEVAANVGAPAFGEVLRDAAGALLTEQDAFLGRSRWTVVPTPRGRFSRPQRNKSKLSPLKVVLGFSGGKDSIVSLFTLIESGYEVIPVLLNEGDRTWQDLRKWFPKLRRLGLDPMVPYLGSMRRGKLHHRYGDHHYSSYQIGWLTALLAICAVRSGAATICLGIERSADETDQRYRDRWVNHQHQKTTKHLRRLERFYRRVLHDGLRLASPIAECSDAEVLRILLERVPTAYRAFSSCGAANSKSKHCGDCEKCAFVYALLSASRVGRRLAARIFRSELLENVELYRPWIDARYRAPLACVGPRAEVWDVLEGLVQSGGQSAVVRWWADSSVRNERFLPEYRRLSRNGSRPSPADLAKHLPCAADRVRRWLGQSS